MNYNLEGELRMGGSVALDSTLTLTNAAAQAKAAGDAINAVREIADKHVADIKNPHGVTKEQLGLGNVDNTSDSNKPVSKAQSAAIKEVKTSLENTKVDKEAGKGLSSNDFTDAYKTKLDGIEAGANKYVLQDGSVTLAKLGSDVTAQALGAIPNNASASSIGAAEIGNNGKVKPDQICSAVLQYADTGDLVMTADMAGCFLRLRGRKVIIPTDANCTIFPIGTEFEISTITSDDVVTLATEAGDTQFLSSSGLVASVTTTNMWPVVAVKRLTNTRWIVKGDLA